MAGAKLIVIYPRPTDIDAFDKVYGEEHVPMAVEKLSGKTRIVATRILGSPQGVPPFHVIAEVHFPTIEALQNCAASDGGKETLAHAHRSLPEGARSSWSRRRKSITSTRRS
jgi:uncharacterized protein (TIGR02118 family)